MITRHKVSLGLAAAGLLALVPTLGLAGSRTSLDLGTRVALLEQGLATSQADLATTQQELVNTQAALNAHIADTGNAHNHDARYVKDSGGEDLRVIRGAVFPPDTVAAGADFTVSQIATGVFRITYDTPFTDRPSVLVMPRDAVDRSSWENASPVSVDVRLFDTAGVEVDGPFYFLAIGPQ